MSTKRDYEKANLTAKTWAVRPYENAPPTAHGKAAAAYAICKRDLDHAIVRLKYIHNPAVRKDALSAIEAKRRRLKAAGKALQAIREGGG